MNVSQLNWPYILQQGLGLGIGLALAYCAVYFLYLAIRKTFIGDR